GHPFQTSHHAARTGGRMPDACDFAQLNAGKEGFDDIYNQPDPRAYYHALGRLGYAIPTHAKPVLRATPDALCAARGLASPTVLDLGCSYGVNAAHLQCGRGFAELRERYDDPATAPAATAEVILDDASWYGEHAVAAPVTVVGVDVAQE